MRSAFCLALALTVSASGAWAQSSSRSDDDRRGGDDYRREWREERGRGGDDRGGWRDHHGFGGSGARFRLRNGDAVVAVNCGDNESMRACVDATLTLLDRLKSMQPAAGSTAPSSPAPTPPTPPTR